MQRSFCKGSGLKLKPEGTASLGLSAGNGIIPRAVKEITFIIRWDDQEETVAARAK